MIRIAALVVSAVELGAGFGAATATVVSTTDQSIVIEMHVEVDAPADTVVAHLSLPGEETVTIPMLPREDREYGVTTEIRAADYVIVFEAIGESGAQSDPVTLSDLGADLRPDASTATTESDEPSPATRRWLWLGVALGAASLSALAFWVLGGREAPDADHDSDAISPEEPISDP